jgi:hypothetical protein
MRTERRRGRDPVEPASRRFDLGAISKRVQCPWVNPEADRLTCAEYSAVFGEHLARQGEAFVDNRHWIEPTDIMLCFQGFYPLNFTGVSTLAGLHATGKTFRGRVYKHS